MKKLWKRLAALLVAVMVVCMSGSLQVSAKEAAKKDKVVVSGYSEDGSAYIEVVVDAAGNPVQSTIYYANGSVYCETEHFVFFCTNQDAAALGDLIASFEGNYDRVTTDLGKAPATKTRVNIFPDIKTYHNAVGRPNDQDWSVGEARNGQIYMVSPLNPGSAHSYDSVITIAVHEYVHIVVEQFNRYQKPYLSEGIACYEAGQLGNLGNIWYYAMSGNLPSLTYLENSNSAYAGEIYYTFGPAYIDFVVKTFGFDKVIAQLEGKTPEEVFGMSREELNQYWMAYLLSYAN